MPGVEIHGTALFEWLDEQRALLAKWHYEHPDIPDALAVIATLDGKLKMHYFDPRGVHRVFDVGIDDQGWWYANDVPGFAQRYKGAFSSDGFTITGVVELCADGVNWLADLPITYRRVEGK